MNRRTAAIVAASVAVLAGCSDSRGTNSAAEVDGTAVTRERFEQLLRDAEGIRDAQGNEDPRFQPDPETGTVDAEVGRQLLSILVLDVVGRQYLEEAGESITDDDRQLARDGLGAQAETLPPGIVEIAVDQGAIASAIGRVAAGEAQDRYDASPAELGVMCVRHIVVETEEEAADVLAEVEGGADFAAVAAERSIEPVAAETGGALELQQGQPCLTVEQAEAQLDPAFVEGALEAVPGTPVGPVQSSFGWHVILARPYDEVAESVDAVVGQALFAEHLQAVDVDVDPRYGRWDADATAVVAL